SHVRQLGLIEAKAYQQRPGFDAGVQFARVEGILPAPEANHAVKRAVDEAIRCRAEGVSRAILFNLCCHGHFGRQWDMDCCAGRLEDRDSEERELARALAGGASVKGAA